MKIDFAPLKMDQQPVKNALKIGISANMGLHTNELVCGVALGLEDEIATGNETAHSVSFVWKDDERRADTARNVAEEFKAEKVDYVIGHLSASASIPASDVYAKNNTCLFASGTTHPSLCKSDKPFVFRVCPLDTDQANVICELIESKFSSSDVYLVIQDIEYGYVLSDLIEKSYTGDKLHKLLAGPTLTNEQLDAVNSGSRDRVVVLCAIHEYSATYVDQLAASGYDGDYIVGDDCDIPNFFNLLKSKNLPIHLPKIDYTNLEGFSSQIKRLSARYHQLRGEMPGAYFYTSYIACRTLINAINILRPMNSKQLYDGILGGQKASDMWLPFKFDNHGNLENIGWKMSFTHHANQGSRSPQ